MWNKWINLIYEKWRKKENIEITVMLPQTNWEWFFNKQILEFTDENGNSIWNIIQEGMKRCKDWMVTNKKHFNRKVRIIKELNKKINNNIEDASNISIYTQGEINKIKRLYNKINRRKKLIEEKKNSTTKIYNRYSKKQKNRLRKPFKGKNRRYRYK